MDFNVPPTILGHLKSYTKLVFLTFNASIEISYSLILPSILLVSPGLSLYFLCPTYCTFSMIERLIRACSLLQIGKKHSKNIWWHAWLTVSLVALRVKQRWQTRPVVSNLLLNLSTIGAITTSSVRLFQVFATRTEKKELLVFSLHLGLISFKLLPLVSLPKPV